MYKLSKFAGFTALIIIASTAQAASAATHIEPTFQGGVCVSNHPSGKPVGPFLCDHGRTSFDSVADMYSNNFLIDHVTTLNGKNDAVFTAIFVKKAQ